MLFSFLPFMVSDFFPEYNREQLGKKLIIQTIQHDHENLV